MEPMPRLGFLLATPSELESASSLLGGARPLRLPEDAAASIVLAVFATGLTALLRRGGLRAHP